MSTEVEPKPVQRKPLEWFNLKGKRVGFWAYVVMRLSALGLVLYLVLHLGILSQLAMGPSAWDGFVAMAKSPAFLLLDVVLIIGILAHGLNGIRLALIGFGIGVPRQKVMLWIGLVLTIVFSLLSALAIFSEVK
jgi:succinate dehydrogenase / fumarate reductase, cytochrome b subunit